MPDDIARHELEMMEESPEYTEMVEELEVLKKQASNAEVDLADLQDSVNIKQKRCQLNLGYLIC